MTTDTSRLITIMGFLLIGAALVVVHFQGKRAGSRIPSFADLCGFLMRERWGRLGVVLTWFWLGWHFLARS
jgi:Family of unknown function (DUF6186)